MNGLIALAPEELEAVAAGRADPATLDSLVTAQRSKRRLLLLALRRAASGPAEAALADGFGLLETAESVAPGAVDDVIGRPLTNAWAIEALRAVVDPDRSASADVGFLSALAAAAAVRAGVDFDIRVPAPGGVAYLPGLGQASGLGGEHAIVRADPSGAVVVGEGATVRVGDGPGWTPAYVAPLDGDRPWALGVEDQDPYRWCFGLAPTALLDGAQRAAFGRTLAAAWALTSRDFPAYAQVMRRTLRSVVPLAAVGERTAISAASQLAYGTVAASLPPDAATMALLLIHEQQHMTLGAVYDVAPLCAPDGLARHDAPWRLDPRPVHALLQGTFAHLGVTDFWRVHRHTAADPVHAEFEFAYWRELTARATRTLLGSGELTAAGQRFVGTMADTVEGWWDERISPSVAATVREMADVRTVMWRLRNRPVPADQAQRLGREYASGVECAPLAAPAVATAAPTPARHRGLAELIRQRLLAVDPAGDVSAGDHAYLSGDFGAAAAAYRAQIAADPVAEEPWVGLAAALRRAGTEPAATLLAGRPELARAVYVEAGAPSSPDDLAAWLAGGLQPAHHGEGGSR